MDIALITVGHSPRDDLAPELMRLLGEGYRAQQLGGLDAFSPEVIKEEFAPHNDEATMVSRLSSGEMFEMSAAKALPYVQQAIKKAEQNGADAVVLLCTGKFPRVQCGVPLLVPYELMHRLVPGLSLGMRVGALFPFAAFAQEMHEGWQEAGMDVAFASVRPQCSPEELVEALTPMKRAGLDMLVLDCIGYTVEARDFCREFLGVPVLHAKTLLAATLKTLFEAEGGTVRP